MSKNKIKKVRYGKYPRSSSVYITNTIRQTWELKRTGISEIEMRDLLSGRADRAEVIHQLINEGKLVPVYGGDMHF